MNGTSPPPHTHTHGPPPLRRASVAGDFFRAQIPDRPAGVGRAGAEAASKPTGRGHRRCAGPADLGPAQRPAQRSPFRRRP